MSHKKFVEAIHDSDNDEVYEIALDVKQKLRSGNFMPDYEIKQKKFHKFGHVILGYHMNVGGYNPLFQTTGKVVQEKVEDGWYYVKLYPDAQCFKTNLIASHNKQIYTYDKYVKAIFGWDSNNGEWFEYGKIEVYNNSEWHILSNGSCNIFNYNDYNGYGMLNCQATNGYVYIRTENKYIESGNIEYYTAMSINVNSEANENTGIFIYKSKQWFYVATPNIDNICVKKGGMKYCNGKETIWKITGRNTPWEKIYMGRGRNACGYSKTNTEAEGVKGIQRRKWRKLNFTFLSQNIHSFKYKGSSINEFGSVFDGNYILVIENGCINGNNSNKFELYKYIITTSNYSTYYHSKNFLRYLSLEEVYGLNKKYNTQIKLDNIDE